MFRSSSLSALFALPLACVIACAVSAHGDGSSDDSTSDSDDASNADNSELTKKDSGATKDSGKSAVDSGKSDGGSVTNVKNDAGTTSTIDSGTTTAVDAGSTTSTSVCPSPCNPMTGGGCSAGHTCVVDENVVPMVFCAPTSTVGGGALCKSGTNYCGAGELCAGTLCFGACDFSKGGPASSAKPTKKAFHPDCPSGTGNGTTCSKISDCLGICINTF